MRMSEDSPMNKFPERPQRELGWTHQYRLVVATATAVESLSSRSPVVKENV
jgi:hypothetical protein